MAEDEGSIPEGIDAGEWEASQRHFPSDLSDLLETDAVAEACRRTGISPESERALRGALPDLREERRARLFWHFHYLLYRDPECTAERVDDWARLPVAPHPASILLFGLVFLSGVPHTLRRDAARGIQPAITEGALRRFGRVFDTARATGQVADLVRRWTVYPLVGRLYRLGRLEFLFDRFPVDYHVFRHRGDGRVIVLAGNGMRFRGDGQHDGANGVCDAAGGWTATFAEDADKVSGSPISPYGYAIRRGIRLATSDWEAILRQGDPTLSVHIPATGPMTPEACRAAFAEASRFFPAHFPDRPFAAYTCCSWLMDPQFEERLPAESNIVRFLRQFYLLPIPGASDRAAFHWIFQGKPEDLTSAPRETTLQRAILDHAVAGGHWRNAGGILLKDGTEFTGERYRNRLAPTLLEGEDV